ncbi:MAG: oxygenase MpaB family protein [Algiphilus sp.]
MPASPRTARDTRRPEAHAAGFIPARHGADVAAQRRLAGPIRWLIRGDPEPDPARWKALGEALMHGDPLADAVVDWMHSVGMREGWRVFQRALDEGLDAIEDPPEALAELLRHCEQWPAWVEPETMARGARVVHELGMTSHYVLRDVALMGGYQAAAINPPLILTGALDGGTARRIAETMQWVVDATASGGLERFAPGFKSTLHVRVLHALIRQRLSRRADWDTAELGLPINQTDMAATFLGFSVVQLFAVRFMGVPLNRRDARAVMHLWKAIAWLIGTDERWLTDDEQEGRKLLYQITLSQKPPDESSRKLGRSLMEETMGVPYPFPRRLRARFEQARHLSVTRFFVGREGMRHLGLPAWMPPWYPLLSAPATFGWHLAHRLLPGGRARLARRGRKAHEALVALHFAGQQRALARPAAEA